MSKENSVFKANAPVVGFESLLSKLPDDASVKNRKATRSESLEQARKEAEQTGYDEGFQRGHADGYARGLIEGQEQGRADGFREAADQRRQALACFTSELDKVQLWFRDAIDEWFDQSEQRMTDLAIEAVKAILNAELQISRESAVDLVKKALREVTHARHARVRINPFDSVLLQQHRSELIAASGSLKDIELVDDPAIVGGCIIETDGGVLDASVGTQLSSLEHAIGEAA